MNITQAGVMSSYDYWSVFSNFYTDSGFSSLWSDWVLLRSNEHFLFIPSVIYALNVVATQGSNLGLCAITLLIASGQIILLIQLLPTTLRRSPWIRLLLIIGVSAFNFTPAAAHNWMLGFSGIAWLLGNLFSILAIWGVVQFSQHQRPYQNVLGLIAPLLGVLSYSTALAVWPALVVLAIWLRLHWSRIAVYCGLMVCFVAWYSLAIYQKPSHHPLPSSDFNELFSYVFIYLGGIFSNQSDHSQVLGFLGFLLAFGLGFIIWRSLPTSAQVEAFPWLALQVYVGGTAAMATLGRSGFGLSQALSSRYATLPALFWMSTMVLLLLTITHLPTTRPLQRYLYTGCFAFFTALIIAMYGAGHQPFQFFAARAKFQPIVALSLQLGIHDIDLISNYVTTKPEQFLKVLDWLETYQLIPFERNLLQDNSCIAMGQVINDVLIENDPSPSSIVEGRFDGGMLFTETTGVATGWGVAAQANSIRCIAFVNQDHIVRGFGIVGTPRPDVQSVLNLPAHALPGWRGYFQLEVGDEDLSAYAILDNQDYWIPLPKSDNFEIQNPNKI